LKKIPKVELHVHIEGTLEPDLLLKLAERNGVSLPYNDLESVREVFRFQDLQGFLNVYYSASKCLQKEQDFYDLTLAYLRKCKEENIVYTEIFFDPQTHIARGIALEEVMAGIFAARSEAEARFGVRSQVIPCFERDRPVGDSLPLLKTMERIGGIVGIGLDSAERDNPPSIFNETFAYARSIGLHCVAHAGEEGPPEYIAEALDILAVERIDHGVRAMESTALMQRLQVEQTPLTVCPFSNVALGVFEDLACHNVGKLLEAGLKVTINSDDPAYFGGYLTANIVDTWNALGLSLEQVIQVQRNAIDATFIDAAEKYRMHRALEESLFV
jgi:adenosine deaminase